MVSRFDEVLHLMDPEQERPVAGLRAGPCGRGPVDKGATILSMQVWLFQSGSDGQIAMATGRAGEDVGSPPEQPPYDDGKWMIRTGLDDRSGTFDVEAPASARAIAIVRRPDGTTAVEEWSQDVRLHGGGPRQN